MSRVTKKKSTALLPFIRETFIREVLSRRSWMAILALLSLVLGVATYIVFSRLSYTSNEGAYITALLIMDLACLSALTIMVVRRLTNVWVSNRHGKAGSRLHSRMVILFGFIAAGPTVILTVFSALFFHFGVESWFDERFSRGINNAGIVAEAYFEEAKKQIASSVTASADDLKKNIHQWIKSKEDRQKLLLIMIRFRNLSGVTLYDGKGNVIGWAEASQGDTGNVGKVLDKPLDFFPSWVLENANKGNVSILESLIPGCIGAVYEFKVEDKVYYFAGWQRVQQDMLEYAKQTQEALDNYKVLGSKKFEIQIAFSVIFAFISLLILLGAIGVGLIMANALSVPISNLVKGARRVAQGDMNVTVPYTKGIGDLKVLVDAFNIMVEEVQEQKNQLLKTNRELGERTAFIESVLSGVSSGVIELTKHGSIRVINDKALKLLELDYIESSVDITSVFPQVEELFHEALVRDDGKTSGEVHLENKKHETIFFVRFNKKKDSQGLAGFVLTFDDITPQIQAQRQAAWRDVARRIAHEIKNPLTPIQLSTERLKKCCAHLLKGKEMEVFSRCVDTIARQVVIIGSMVKDFSDFARMPLPEFRCDDIKRIVEDSVNLQAQAYSDIDYEFVAPSIPIYMDVDSQKITQVMTNLLKNATESILENNEKVSSGDSVVRISLEENKGFVTINVEDNGKGWPDGSRKRLIEPYFTTRSKGTGLGLSIVNRIIDEHGGCMFLESSTLGGASIRLVMPKKISQTEPEKGSL